MKLKFLAATVLLLTSSTLANATTLTFNNEAAWQAAVGVFGFENFDALPGGTNITTLAALGIALDPLNDGSQPTVQPYSFTGGVVQSGPNNILNDSDNTLPGRGPITVRPILATDFIFGFGLWNVGGDDTLRLTFYDSSNIIITSVISAISSGFFGIVDDTGARYAVIDFVGGNGYAPTDDWQAATRATFEPPQVPIPAALPLLAAGLGAMGYLGSRRKRKAASAA